MKITTLNTALDTAVIADSPIVEPPAIEPDALNEPWIVNLREGVITARQGLVAAKEANAALKAAVAAIDTDREKIMARLAELTAPKYRATDIEGVEAHMKAVADYQQERDTLNRQLADLTTRWGLTRPLLTPAQEQVTKAGVAVTHAVDACWRAYADRMKAELAPAIELLRCWKLASNAGGIYQEWKYVTADLLEASDQTANQLLADMAARLAIPGEVKPTVFTGVTSFPAPITAPSGPTPQTMIEAQLRAVQHDQAVQAAHDDLRAQISRINPPAPAVPADQGGSGWSDASGKGGASQPTAADWERALFQQVAG